MRTLILHSLDNDNPKHKTVLQNLVKGAQSRDNQVDIFDAVHDSPENLHIAYYKYIAVVVPSLQFIGAKPVKKLEELFASCGSAAGKKGCALVLKFGLSSNKMCNVLMDQLERQGMKLDYFEVIENAEHSVAVGKKIG